MSAVIKPKPKLQSLKCVDSVKKAIVTRRLVLNVLLVRILQHDDLFRAPKLGDHRHLMSQLHITANGMPAQVPFECHLTFDRTDQTNQHLVMPNYTDRCKVTLGGTYVS